MQQQPYIWNGVYQTPAPNVPDWAGWAQRLYQSEQKLQQMAEQLANLQKQLDEKNKQPLHIEYHFDQLKVTRLEGTLNVGLSPQGINGIESFEAPDPTCWKVNSDPIDENEVLVGGLQNDISTYMSTSSKNDLIDLETQSGVSLDDNHRQTVVDDVKRQVNDRVRYYAKTTPYPSSGSTEDQMKWQNSIKEKTKRDIKNAFSNYLSKQQQSQKEGPTTA
ncbi:spore germination protein GerPC [Cohnella abietis]|uniref:Putative spore germination protein GerPC n=1 Tax=Cohnella abietis TaxID=2507935 RepID=A0A3T1D4K7_9BACL|nr:spore germination protein GerPC [Cohnella abietis]BBI33042.1 putative spore germination protein GerPC [Cohnella abietis]